MFIQFTKEQQQLQKKISKYLEKLMTPALRNELDKAGATEGGGPEFRKALRQMGTDGWISIGWPKELGGGGATPIEQYIFTEEISRLNFPYPFLTTDSIGPILAKHGSQELQEEFVKPILRGELIFAIGYSEPAAGTDLASLKTRAVRDGDEWVINGQKIWTSLADYADYIWLAARTDPDAPKHKGISVFIVPTSDPGFSVSPISTLGDIRTNTTFYEDIRIPAKYLVGEENKGWQLITGQLNRERLALVNHGAINQLYKNVCEWATKTKAQEGGFIIERPWVQQNLAKVYVGLEALKLTCWKQAWAMTENELGMADASSAKVYGTEFFIEAYRLLMEIAGTSGLLRKGDESAILNGALEHRYRTGSVLTFGGGTNEVQRDIVAMAGLLMPRGR